MAILPDTPGTPHDDQQCVLMCVCVCGGGAGGGRGRGYHKKTAVFTPEENAALLASCRKAMCTCRELGGKGKTIHNLPHCLSPA